MGHDIERAERVHSDSLLVGIFPGRSVAAGCGVSTCSVWTGARHLVLRHGHACGPPGQERVQDEERSRNADDFAADLEVLEIVTRSIEQDRRRHCQSRQPSRTSRPRTR